MLPTNQRAVNKGDLVLDSVHRLFIASNNMRPNSLISDYYKSQHLYIVSDEPIKEGDWIIYDNKVGVYKYDSIANTHDIVVAGVGTFPFQTKEYYKKIIATTDKSIAIEHSTLSIPQRKGLVNDYPVEKIIIPSPSPEFVQAYIKAYNAGTLITEVMVEYEEYAVGNYGMSDGEPDTDIRLKIDRYNHITITHVKDSWTREELDVILNDFARAAITVLGYTSGFLRI